MSITIDANGKRIGIFDPAEFASDYLVLHQTIKGLKDKLAFDDLGVTQLPEAIDQLEAKATDFYVKNTKFSKSDDTQSNKQDKKLLAKKLFVNKGKTAKFTAKEVGVSANTMSSWVIKNDWKGARERFLCDLKPVFSTGERIDFINQLKSYLRTHNQYHYTRIKPSIDEFLTLIK